MIFLKTFYDVQQFLKGYGTIIYTGNRLGDIELMSEEIRELRDSMLIDDESFKQANLVFQEEIRNLK